jgi:hypothetical protein
VLLLGIGITVLYAAVVPVTGFFLTTAFYLVAFIGLGRYRRMWLALYRPPARCSWSLLHEGRLHLLPIGVAPVLAVSAAHAGHGHPLAP